MGMYTELIFGASMKRDAPKEVINTLHYLIKGVKLYDDVDIHYDSWDRNVLNGAGSYYFGVCGSVSEMWFDGIRREWVVSSRTNIKNYNNEIERFLEWVKPFIESGSGLREMYAITIYEEQSEPTIYYLHDSEPDRDEIL